MLQSLNIEVDLNRVFILTQGVWFAQTVITADAQLKLQHWSLQEDCIYPISRYTSWGEEENTHTSIGKGFSIMM